MKFLQEWAQNKDHDGSWVPSGPLSQWIRALPVFDYNPPIQIKVVAEAGAFAGMTLVTIINEMEKIIITVYR